MEDRIYSQVFAHRLEVDCKDEMQFSEEKAHHILDDAERFGPSWEISQECDGHRIRLSMI